MEEALLLLNQHHPVVLAKTTWVHCVQTQVAAGCARMEEALLLLNDGGAPLLAPALQQDIQESLHDLKPQCVLDHLKVATALLCSAMHTSSAVLLHECFLMISRMISRECFTTLLLTTVPRWAH